MGHKYRQLEGHFGSRRLLYSLYAYAKQYIRDANMTSIVHFYGFGGTSLSVNFVEGPCVRKARIPNFIHHLDSLHVILTRWPVHYRLDRPCPYAVLVLLSQSVVVPCPKFSHPPALAAQARSSNLSNSQRSFPLEEPQPYLCARRMPQVRPVNFPP